MLEYFGNSVCVDASISANNKDNIGDMSSGIFMYFDH